MADEKYNAKVEEYILTDSPVVFGNYDSDHAKCVIKSFLCHAKKSILLLSGTFPEDFYGENIVNELRAAKKRISGDIRVITLDGKISPVLKKLCDAEEIEYRAGLYTGDEISHFMVVDGKRYRLEAPHEATEDETPEIVKAEVCCNGVKKASELIAFFEKAWRLLAPTQGRATS